MSVSLQLIPLAIAAFKPIREEKTIQYVDLGVSEYCTNMKEMKILREVLFRMNVDLIEDRGKEVYFCYHGYKCRAYKRGDIIHIRFNTLSEVHCDDIVKNIFEEYLVVTQENIYNNVLSMIEEKNYILEKQVVDVENNSIIMTIVL